MRTGVCVYLIVILPTFTTCTGVTHVPLIPPSFCCCLTNFWTCQYFFFLVLFLHQSKSINVLSYARKYIVTHVLLVQLSPYIHSPSFPSPLMTLLVINIFFCESPFSCCRFNDHSFYISLVICLHLCLNNWYFSLTGQTLRPLLLPSWLTTAWQSWKMTRSRDTSWRTSPADTISLFKIRMLHSEQKMCTA